AIRLRMNPNAPNQKHLYLNKVNDAELPKTSAPPQQFRRTAQRRHENSGPHVVDDASARRWEISSVPLASTSVQQKRSSTESEKVIFDGKEKKSVIGGDNSSPRRRDNAAAPAARCLSSGQT
ncbi:Chaperone protein 1, partial [Frankliniella fusca]